MSQTGCPTGHGNGRPGKRSSRPEFKQGSRIIRGTTSIGAGAARPDSGDSQFLICFGGRGLPQTTSNGGAGSTLGHGKNFPGQDQARRAGCADHDKRSSLPSYRGGMRLDRPLPEATVRLAARLKKKKNAKQIQTWSPRED